MAVRFIRVGCWLIAQLHRFQGVDDSGAALPTSIFTDRLPIIIITAALKGLCTQLRYLSAVVATMTLVKTIIMNNNNNNNNRQLILK